MSQGSFDPPSAMMTSVEAERWHQKIRAKPADSVCPAGCPKAAHGAGVGVRDCICWWLDPCWACDSIVELDRLGVQL